jgi:hypothetical protein
VGATIDSANVVGEAQQVIGIGIDTPLQCDFDLNAVPLTLNVDDFFMDGLFVVVDVLNVLFDAAFVVIARYFGLDQTSAVPDDYQ